MINAEHIIKTIDDMARTHYRDGETADRLAYQVGLLQGKIRELANLMNSSIQELDEILADHDKKKLYLVRVK
ncbi:hypothetical protein EBT31_21070 [bacterium]|nr:hypothetical protein [bacterium]